MAALATAKVKAAVRIHADNRPTRLVVPTVVDGASRDCILITFRDMNGKTQAAKMDYLAPNADLHRLTFTSLDPMFDLPDSKPCSLRSGTTLTRPFFDVPIPYNDVFWPFRAGKVTYYCQVRELNGKLFLMPHNGDAIELQFSHSDTRSDAQMCTYRVV